MKTCPACHKRKPVEEFNWKYKAKGIRSPTCRECMRLYIREHYKNNVDYYVKKAMRRKRLYQQEVHRKIFGYFSSHPCVDRGENDPMVLEFDHLEKKNKIAAVSEMVSLQSPWEVITKEIQKCEVRSANCHRRKTAKQRGYYLYMTADS